MQRFFLGFGLFSLVAAGACATSRSVPFGSGGSGGEGGTTSTSSSSTTSSSHASSSSTGAGGCTMAADCVGMSDACNVGACINGVCSKMPANENQGCDDKDFCTDNETCTNGICGGGTPHYCASADECHIGSCDMGKCTQLPGNDGAKCDDKDPCTQAGQCMTGTCMPGPPIDCSFFDGPCAKGVCDPVNGCVAQDQPDGTACDDKLYCTINDSCQQGQCTGQPNPCVAPGDVCKIATCDENTKSCIIMPGNNGAACDDQNTCTSGETCSNGTCQGGQPANNGGACDDHAACTTNDVCNNKGVCGGTPIVVCKDNDGCCPAGCSLATDNDCQCGTNEALTATPSTSGGGSPPNYGPAEINNKIGKVCNEFNWVANSQQPSGAWAELDWPAQVSIGSFYIETDDGQNPLCGTTGRNIASATVQWWNGNSWVNAGSWSNQHGDIKYNMPQAVATTKLRIFDMTTDPGNGNSIIFEWHVYAGTNCSPPP